MAEIVLVHGIDQHRKSAELLERGNDDERGWLEALADGVGSAGFSDLADSIWSDGSPGAVEASMAFYGHLYVVSGQMGDDPGDFAEEEQDLAEKLALEWLERAAMQASRKGDKDTATRELRSIRGDLGTPQGPGEIARKTLKSLAKLRWFAPFGMAFAEKFVNRALAQVTRYLTDETIRKDAQDIVRSLITPDTKVIIGHSLGSVVAYEVAQGLEQPLPLLVTIGSPLGLNTIIHSKLRPQPPSYPAQVKRWVNVADHDDLIAAELNLTNVFKAGIPADAVFEGGYTTDNGAKPHSADSYLSSVDVGRPVGYVLSQGSGGGGGNGGPE